MAFDYNYHICPICEQKLNYNRDNEAKCENGCCHYEVDPQGEIVNATLFGKERFFLELYKEAILDWHPLSPEDYERQEKMNKRMEHFLERVLYWKSKTG